MHKAGVRGRPIYWWFYWEVEPAEESTVGVADVLSGGGVAEPPAALEASLGGLAVSEELLSAAMEEVEGSVLG
jgi:hypothetical protein